MHTTKETQGVRRLVITCVGIEVSDIIGSRLPTPSGSSSLADLKQEKELLMPRPFGVLPRRVVITGSVLEPSLEGELSSVHKGVSQLDKDYAREDSEEQRVGGNWEDNLPVNRLDLFLKRSKGTRRDGFRGNLGSSDERRVANSDVCIVLAGADRRAKDVGELRSPSILFLFGIDSSKVSSTKELERNRVFLRQKKQDD